MSRHRAPGPIPSAPVDNLDLDLDEDEAEWEHRVMDLASERLMAARTRLQGLGIVDESGKLVSDALLSEMMPDSDSTLETG